MSEFKAMKFWIGDDPELSEKVQKILFDMGYKWGFRGKEIQLTDAKSLYTDLTGYILQSSSGKSYFNNEPEEEQNIDWMRSPKKVEYVELGGKKYIKEELEEALSKINPVED